MRKLREAIKLEWAALLIGGLLLMAATVPVYDTWPRGNNENGEEKGMPTVGVIATIAMVAVGGTLAVGGVVGIITHAFGDEWQVQSPIRLRWPVRRENVINETPPTPNSRLLPQTTAPPIVRPYIPKVVESADRVSVTEDIDGNYFRLKVTNLATERQEFEVKFLDFHGTRQKETDYAARWRGTGNPGERLKANSHDYINAVECLGIITNGCTTLRFYTADLPTSPSNVSHYFDRQIPVGYAVMWTFEVYVEPPLASPLRHTCTVKVDGNGWVEDFAIDKSWGGVTGPATAYP